MNQMLRVVTKKRKTESHDERQLCGIYSVTPDGFLPHGKESGKVDHYTPNGSLQGVEPVHHHPRKGWSNAKSTVQLTLTQIMDDKETEKNKNCDEEEEEEKGLGKKDRWYNPYLHEMTGGLYIPPGGEYVYDSSLSIIVPRFDTWTKKVDRNKETMHACVYNSEGARSMVLDKNTGNYIKHHGDPRFIQENHMRVNGMIYMWQLLAVPILSQIEDENEAQYGWAKHELPEILNSVNEHKDSLIGSLNTHYIQKHVKGLCGYEEALFAGYMANCTRYELCTRIQPFFDGKPKMKLITKIYRSTDKEFSTLEMPVKYVFGTDYFTRKY